MSTTRRIEVLGPVRALRAGRPVALRGVTGRTVATCLVLAEGRTVSVDHLVDALWGDYPPPSAGNVIQSAVSRLRAGIGRDAVPREGDGYRLELAVVTTDLAELERLSQAAAIAGDPAAAAALLEDALALWRGEALIDVAPTTLLLPERARLEELRASLRDRRHLARIDAGDGADIIADLQRDAHHAPLRESTQVLLMRALADSGRVAEALRLGAAFRDRLVEETGLSPTPSFATAEQQLLSEYESTATPPATPFDESRPAASSPTTVAQRQWMPPDNEFVGRDEVAGAVRRLLHSRRLITILGPGGVGKTRLAMELVRHRSTQLPEIVVIELATVEPDQEILSTVAGELGLASTGADLVAAIAERLELFTGLVVLDNCEHVRHRARDLAEQVLRRAPSVRILTTSRRRLGLPDEHVVRLEPLPLPGRNADEPTVRLFLDRMERVHPSRSADPNESASSAGSAPVASAPPDPATLDAAVDICRAVEGMPLAIELAASRVALLGLDELRSRLAASLEVLSLPGPGARRQATLDATIDWSIDLLDPVTVAVLEQLSVFPDRFELADADAVVATDDVLPAVAELVESSLVTVEGAGPIARYRLLAPIRDRARRRLEAAGGAPAALDAHADRALALGAHIEASWTGAEPPRPPSELAQRRADFVSALRHLGESGRTDDADRLARQIAMGLLERPDAGFSSLLPTITGRSVDAVVARAVIGAAVGRPQPDELADLEAAFAGVDAHDHRSHLLRFAFVPAHLYRGDTDAAMAACHAMLADDDTPPRLRVLAVSMWALAEGLLGRYDVGRSILDSHTDVLGLAEVGGFVSYVRAEVAAGTDPDEALGFLDEALAESGEAPLGFVGASAGVLRVSLLVHRNAHDEAVELARRLVPELLAAGTIPHVWRVFRSMGHVLVDRGHPETAARALASAEADPRAPVVLGPWTETIGRLWGPITDALGPERVAEIRAEGAGVSLRNLWAEVEAAIHPASAMPD
ncbi:MAG: AfsR/SARP family transcriptional regulator [Acidimicrobiales bacterium]